MGTRRALRTPVNRKTQSIPPFRSSIPSRAEARPYRDPDGMQSIDYFLDGARVGHRLFDAEGNLVLDQGWRDGRLHGTCYRLDIPGRLLSATPYHNGLEHGVARQWGDDGRLLGTYRMTHGTGLDLWWAETHRHPRKRYLKEVYHYRRGRFHGFEWWIEPDQRSVYEERHWVDGLQHGIERTWNGDGRLRRGFPKYFLKNEQVSRRAYLRACASDAKLPPFRPQDNRPRRSFPPNFARHLGDDRQRT
jgi:hypothetical protein